MFNEYENKMMKVKTKSLKINSPLRGLSVGDVIEIKVDKAGVPLERYWRDRLKESKTDNCVEILKGSKK